MTKFTEEKLELAFIELLEKEDILYLSGADIQRTDDEVLIKEDLISYLSIDIKLKILQMMR